MWAHTWHLELHVPNRSIHFFSFPNPSFVGHTIWFPTLFKVSKTYSIHKIEPVMKAYLSERSNILFRENWFPTTLRQKRLQRPLCNTPFQGSLQTEIDFPMPHRVSYTCVKRTKNMGCNGPKPKLMFKIPPNPTFSNTLFLHTRSLVSNHTLQELIFDHTVKHNTPQSIQNISKTKQKRVFWAKAYVDLTNSRNLSSARCGQAWLIES